MGAKEYDASHYTSESSLAWAGKCLVPNLVTEQAIQ